MQRFGRTLETNEFRRLDIDMSKFGDHTSRRLEFEKPPQWGNISATRYDATPADIAEPSTDPRGLPQEPVEARAK